MSTPDRLLIVVASNTRAVRKWVRGFVAERDDSELTDALFALTDPLGLVQPEAVPLGGGWQRPRVSATGTLCLWAVWLSQITPRGIARLATGAANNLDQIRLYSGDEDWKTPTGWTN